MNTSSIKSLLKNNISQFMLVFELVVIFTLFSILTDNLFLTPINITNLLMQACTFSLMAIGMVFLLIGGQIDLSAGAVVGFLGSVAAMLQVEHGWSTPATIVATLAAGLLIGCWNGFWVAYMKIPAFIVTLSGMLIFKGATLMVGGGKSIGPMADSFCVIGQGYVSSIFTNSINDTTLLITLVGILLYAFVQLSKRRAKMKHGFAVPKLRSDLLKLVVAATVIGVMGYVLAVYKGIPYAGILLLIMTILFMVVSTKTPFGRHVYAIGGNRDAARLSGVNVERNTMMLFVQMGLITAVASIQYLGRIRQATPQAGANFEFSAITGCIIGGASTMGGIGTVTGAVIGTILVAGIDNGMSLLNLSSEFQYIVKGLVLLLAVMVDILTKRKRA